MRVILFTCRVSVARGKGAADRGIQLLCFHIARYWGKQQGSSEGNWLPLRLPSATHFIQKLEEVHLKGQFGRALTASYILTTYCLLLIEKKNFFSMLSIYLPDLVTIPVLTQILHQLAALSNEYS